MSEIIEVNGVKGTKEQIEALRPSKVIWIDKAIEDKDLLKRYPDAEFWTHWVENNAEYKIWKCPDKTRIYAMMPRLKR